MLVLGHTGITLGVATALDAILSKTSFLRAYSASPASSSPVDSLPTVPSGKTRTSWFGSLAHHIDIRILLVGSLLPDIIDKPVGHFLFRDVFANGRIFCHTLLFLLVISLAGIFLYRRSRKNWLLVLAFGTFTHLIFDRMWLIPRTLFWPLYGWAFPQGDPDPIHWLSGVLAALLADPSTYIPEVIGAAILGIFLWQLIKASAVGSFIRRGKVE